MAQLATFYYTIGGVPTDADAVNLADAAGAFGIKRLSDGAVIVAAFANTTRVAVGTYTYTYELLGLDPLEQYLISFKAIKSGQPTQYATAVIEVSAGAATLLNLRRRLAQELGSLKTGWSGAQAAANSGYVGTSSGAEQRRRLASSDLVAINADWSAAEAIADAYDGAYVYFPAVQRQRQIAAGSYNGSVVANTVLTAGGTDTVGTVILTRPDSDLITAGRAFELHTILPVIDDGPLIGLHTHLRRAFETIKIRSRLPLAGVAGQYRYDLSAYPWLREGMLLGVFGPESATGVQGRAVPARLRFDGGTPQLDLQWAIGAGETAYVDVRRPLSSWVRVGGVWADSVSGPLAETDEVAYDPQRLVEVAAYYAYDHLAHVDPRGMVPDAARRRDRLAAIHGPLLQQERQDSEADAAARPRLRTRAWGSWRPRGTAWP